MDSGGNGLKPSVTTAAAPFSSPIVTGNAVDIPDITGSSSDYLQRPSSSPSPNTSLNSASLVNTTSSSTDHNIQSPNLLQLPNSIPNPNSINNATLLNTSPSSLIHNPQSPNLINFTSSPNVSKPQLTVLSPLKSIFISRFAEFTSEKDIQSYILFYINSLNESDLSVSKFKFKNKLRKTASFKITVPPNIFSTILNSSFWPEDVIVHEFIAKPKIPKVIPATNGQPGCAASAASKN